jgi:excisionase family DNA binding protein
MTLNQEYNLMTCEEAATYLRLHARTVGRLLAQGKLPGVKVGRQWRLRRADLDAYLAGGASPRVEHTGGAALGASTETEAAAG